MSSALTRDEGIRRKNSVASKTSLDVEKLKSREILKPTGALSVRAFIGIQSFRTHGRFVPRLRRLVPTFGRFVPNPLLDSYPKNFYTKCFKTNINIYFTYPSNRKKLISNYMNIEKLSFS